MRVSYPAAMTSWLAGQHTLQPNHPQMQPSSHQPLTVPQFFSLVALNPFLIPKIPFFFSSALELELFRFIAKPAWE